MSQKSLTNEQLKVAQLSARGLSLRQIAAATTVSKDTASRWLKMPEVQAQVAKFQQEIEAAHHSAVRSSANQEAMELQERLRTATKRQLAWSIEVQLAGRNLLNRVNYWVGEIDKVVQGTGEGEEESQPGGSQVQFRSMMLLKIAPLIPSYARAAADMTRAGSETEDKIFAIEEINRRLDEWQEMMDGNNSDARQAVALEQ